ncbi:MAG: PAS domain S-box protein [Alphaproteobacteria bacterium]
MPPEEAHNAAVRLRAPTHPLVAMVDLLPKPAVVRRGDDLYVNPATCELTGFQASELATVDLWFKTLYGQRHLAMRLIYERHRRAEDKSVTVMPLTCRDGTHCYVELALSRQGDTEVWLLSDVTERVTSDERFRLLFELSADAHFLHDDAGVIDCNRAAIEITGSGTKSRLIGARLADLLEPDTGVGAGFEAMAALARANGHHRCDAWLRTTGGSTVPVEVTLTSVQLAGRAMLLAVLHDLTERNKSADALRASEERFRQIAEAAGEYIWEIDAGGCYRFASVRIADVLGRPVDEVVGREMFDFVVDEDRALLRQWFEGIRHEKGAFRDVELRSVRPDGAVVRRRESGQPIIGADGALLGFRGVGQDITRLHAAEIDRMRTEARFRELIEGSIQGIVIHRRFKPLFANKAFADMYGFGDIEAVLAEPDIFPMICEAEDDGEGGGYEQIWQRQLAKRQPAYPGRRQVRRRDGAEMWVDVLPRPIDWMGEPALQVTVIDATQKHLAEQAVQRVERHLSDAVESINEGFALWDAADRLVMCNQRFRRLRPGYESLAVPGASVLELAPLMTASCNADAGRAVPDWVAARRQTLDRDQLLRCEEQIAGRWYMISERRTADGGVVGVYSDIDALKRNEEKLRHNEEILNHYIGDLEKSRARVEEQSQRLAELAEMYASERTKADAANEAKSHFLAMMSHELRTPMTGVKGMIDLLQRTTLSKEQDRYVDTLRRSADALLTLLNDILDYSKIEAGRLTIEHTDFDLHGLCDEVLALFADRAVERSTVLRPRIAPDVPATVIGDPTRLRQILSNLVGNAVKFTEKGFIEVRFARDAVQGESGLRLRIEVEDTGIGLNEDQIARLFNAFVQADASTTRKYGGTGLGLAICRRLVEAMHGEIGVSSTPGEGSTFWFTMLVDEPGPAVPAESTADDPAVPGAAPAVEQTVPAAVPSNRIRVLLAEDNPVNRMLIVSMLTGMGYQVDAVENGLHAVRQIERDPAYDLVLMDMQMPEMDGPTATKVIRDMGEPTCRIPIIALTANASPDHRKSYLKAGLDEVLTKPIEWSRLDQVLRMLVARPPAHGTEAESAAEPAPPPPGLFNRRTLRQLAAAMGSQSLKEMVVLMLATAEQSMNDLRQAHADGNGQLVGDVAHCLKGVAANFGAVRVAELAAVLQHPERSERPVDAVIADLEQAVAQTSELIATDFDGLLADQAA